MTTYACPRCGRIVTSLARDLMLSRYDDATQVCTPCASEEALLMGDLIPFHIRLRSPKAEMIREAISGLIRDWGIVDFDRTPRGPVVSAEALWRILPPQEN